MTNMFDYMASKYPCATCTHCGQPIFLPPYTGGKWVNAYGYRTSRDCTGHEPVHVPTVQIMVKVLDNGLLPRDPDDSRTVSEVYSAGLISARDIERMYANYAPSSPVRR